MGLWFKSLNVVCVQCRHRCCLQLKLFKTKQIEKSTTDNLMHTYTTVTYSQRIFPVSPYSYFHEYINPSCKILTTHHLMKKGSIILFQHYAVIVENVQKPSRIFSFCQYILYTYTTYFKHKRMNVRKENQ